MSEHPPFELESYEDKTLQVGTRLLDETELVGHTIKAVVDYPLGRLGSQVDMVIVTETLCWLVLETEDSYSCEERASITVRGRLYSYQASETLHDYLNADQLLEYGLISSGQHQSLTEIENAAKLAEQAKEVETLRAKLAKLEGGAA